MAECDSYFVQQRLTLWHFAFRTLEFDDADEDALLSLVLTGVTQRQRVRLKGEGEDLDTVKIKYDS